MSLKSLLNDYDALLLATSPNTFFATGFKSSHCYVLIFENEQYFLTDMRYFDNAKQYLGDKYIVECIGKNAYDDIFTLLKKNNVKTLGIDNICVRSYFEYKENFKKVKIALCDEQVLTLRSIKSDFEIEKIRQAQHIADEGFSRVLKEIKLGMTEKQLAARLEQLLSELGADSLSFDTIVAFGENSANPHAVPSERNLRLGDNILIDFGCKIDGYCSDMTRTVSFGKPSNKYSEAFYAVKRANELALAAVKAGVSCGTIDNTARQYLRGKGFDKEFCHSLGHGVGLEIHELPQLHNSEKAQNEILSAGMVITIEPGVYFSGEFGIRIEDIVVVRENGVENLTESDKNLIII